MIAEIEAWGRYGENADSNIRITTDDFRLTAGAKKAIVSAIERLEATDGIARNALVMAIVGRRKYEFKYTSDGLKRLYREE